MKKDKFYFTKNPATKKLSELMPIENIENYLSYYHAFGMIDLNKLPDFPYAEVRDIVHGLTALLGQEWLKKEDLEKIWTEIEDRLMIADTCSPFGKSIIKKFLLMKAHKKCTTRGTRSKDLAYDFLIYSIIYDVCKYTSNNPHYKIVIDFLEEQRIVESGTLQYDSLQKDFDRMDHTNMVKILCCMLGLAICENIEAVEQLKHHFRLGFVTEAVQSFNRIMDDVMLPAWVIDFKKKYQKS